MDELAWLFMRTTAELLDEELDAYRAEKPDYVLTDSVAPWGQWMGEILGVPVVTSVTTFAFNRQVMRYGAAHGVRPKSARAFLSKLRHIAKAVRLMRQLRRRYGVNGPGMMGTMSGSSGLTLVYTSREFQPCAASFDDRYRFVGPLLGPRGDDRAFPWETITHPVLLYVSLGTLFNADPAFYRTLLRRLRRTRRPGRALGRQNAFPSTALAGRRRTSSCTRTCPSCRFSSARPRLSPTAG